MIVTVAHRKFREKTLFLHLALLSGERAVRRGYHSAWVMVGPLLRTYLNYTILPRGGHSSDDVLTILLHTDAKLRFHLKT